MNEPAVGDAPDGAVRSAGLPLVEVGWGIAGVGLLFGALGYGGVSGLFPARQLGTAVWAGVAAVLLVAVHETAHFLVARRLGLRAGPIRLGLMSHVRIRSGGPRDRLQVMLAGPVTDLAFALLALALAEMVEPFEGPGATRHALLVTAMVGFFTLGTDLFPLPQTDGGQMVALLFRARGDSTALALRKAHIFGVVVASIAAVTVVAALLVGGSSEVYTYGPVMLAFAVVAHFAWRRKCLAAEARDHKAEVDTRE